MSSVLIVGCGVFGISTAVELSKRGYKVTCVDAFAIPSPLSAANDINKIIRCEYDDIEYTKLALEALYMWRNDPELKKSYVECGRIKVIPKHDGRRLFDERAMEILQGLGQADKVTSFPGNELSSHFPDFRDLNSNESIVFNPESGYGHASNALKIMHSRAVELGVKFVFGEAIVKVDNDKAISTSGKVFLADKIIVSCGASTSKIINLKNQVKATGLFIGHIKLTNEQYEKYCHIPIFFSPELGYFFPPDKDTKLMKIAVVSEECCNIVEDQFGNKGSFPRYQITNPEDTMSEKACNDVKQLLKVTLPQLSDNEVINYKICWISDANNLDFLIDKVPEFSNVFVATGDSGHGFKFLPNIGKYIADRVEEQLQEPWNSRWKWKDQQYPSKISWRIDRKVWNLQDLADFIPQNSKM